MKRIGQGGFATLEVILMVTVIGILASIAVPRFNDITTRANTAKIQSDLTTIDTAIAVYNMNKSTSLTNDAGISVLSEYLDGADKLEPPTSGKCYMGSNTEAAIPTGGYKIKVEEGGKTYAVLGGHSAAEFFYKPAAGT